MPTEEAKTEAILKAALDLFVERGFHGTPVPLVAEQRRASAPARSTATSRSKEALVNALYQQVEGGPSPGTSFNDFPVDQSGARAVPHHLWSAWPSSRSLTRGNSSFLELHHHGSYLDEQSLAMEHSSSTSAS